MIYDVTATRTGTNVTTIRLEASDAATAIDQAERSLNLSRRQYHISEKDGRLHLVEWTGYEFQARQVN